MTGSDRMDAFDSVHWGIVAVIININIIIIIMIGLPGMRGPLKLVGKRVPVSRDDRIC